MAHIYRHKIHGWQITYRVYMPDGSHTTRRSKYSKDEDKAKSIFADTKRLETASRIFTLKREDVEFFKNRKYLTDDEAAFWMQGIKSESNEERRFIRLFMTLLRDRKKGEMIKHFIDFLSSI